MPAPLIALSAMDPAPKARSAPDEHLHALVRLKPDPIQQEEHASCSTTTLALAASISLALSGAAFAQTAAAAEAPRAT